MNDFARLQLLVYIAILVGSFPWLLVMLAGGVVCLRRLSTHPREGWLVGSAIGLTLFASLGLPQLVSSIVGLLQSPGLFGTFEANGASKWIMQFLYCLPASIIRSAAWSLILYAAFGEGSEPGSKYLVEDERIEEEAV